MGLIDSLSRAADVVGAALVKAPQSNIVVPTNNRSVSVSQTPDDIATAMDAQGMNSSAQLGPGRPMGPAFGYNEEPRQYDYRVGQNINNRPRQTERVSFRTLRSLIEAYDIAQLCISHRIASIRGLDWNIVAAPGFEKVDLDTQIAGARKMLAKPDTVTPFDSWLAMWLYDILAFDAGCLYRMRDGFGNFVGLEVIDGTTIAPLIDEYGRRPVSPAPAFKQFVQGLGTIDLDQQHLIYLPYQPISNSLYGRAPIETILLNANTDIRFQIFLMQRFTEGNIPSMLAMAPESWTPDQIIAFQATWDAWMKGDEAAKSQIKWIPGGTKVQETHEANASFNDQLADRLLRKTAAAFHVPPTDLGWTDKSNRSTAESQDSVGERIGDRPLTSYINGIFTRFLQEDFGLPLAFEFMLDTDDTDAVAQATADKIYVDMGAWSASDVAAERFGIEDGPGERIPRYIMTTKGPVPVSNLLASSTAIDPVTEEPEAGTTEPAVQDHILDVLPSVEQTGSASIDATAAKAELATFRKYLDGRTKRGRGWRDFTFKSVPAGLARELNRAGQSEIAKGTGDINVAGLCLYAADTGRVLMLQRSLDPADPNAGTWEFPGGHLEGDEQPIDGAWREWQEEVGCPLRDVTPVSHWDASSRNYQGFVGVVPSEAAVPCRVGSTSILNPDDPDGDMVETVAWIDPATLAGWAALRPELAADLPLVFSALGAAVTAGADAAPLVRKGWRDSTPKVPQHRYDLPLTDYYTPIIQQALTDWANSLPLDTLLTGVAKGEGDDYSAGLPLQPGYRPPNLSGIGSDMAADGWAVGQHSAAEQLKGHVTTVQEVSPAVTAVNWDTWAPGNMTAANMAADGGLSDLLDQAGITINGIEGTLLDDVGNLIADGLSRGDPIRSIRNSLLDSIGSTSRAERIANTETTRAVTAGTFDIYRANRVGEWDLITSDGACPRCVAVEEGNPHSIDDSAGKPPLHPYCRCAAAPRADSIGVS
ncbi:MAG: phage portal protein [Candidatus Lutacidiplasmatales archaeon]